MSTEIKSTLLRAVAKMLRPLVRVLLNNQVSYGEFSSVARRVYVEVADRDFSIPNRKSTYSKVAVMTGIDRKIVQMILNDEKDNLDLLSKPINKGLHVVNAWITEKKYLDKSGKPKVLPLKGKISFESLVLESCADITARAILDELIRVGIVKENSDDTLSLLNETYIPSQDEEQIIRILLHCANDLLVTGVHNLDNLNNPEESPWFQQEVTYKYIPDELLEEYRAYSRKKSKQLIDDINRWLKARKSAAKTNKREHTRRLGIGVYYIETDNEGD